MYNGKTLLAQVMDVLPWKTFHRIVDHYHGKNRVRTLTCVEQFRNMVFAQQMITQARKLYAADSFGGQMSDTVYALDAATIFELPALAVCSLYKSR